MTITYINKVSCAIIIFWDELKYILCNIKAMEYKDGRRQLLVDWYLLYDIFYLGTVLLLSHVSPIFHKQTSLGVHM